MSKEEQTEEEDLLPIADFRELIASGLPDSARPITASSITLAALSMLTTQSHIHMRYTFDNTRDLLLERGLDATNAARVGALLCRRWAFHLGATDNMQAFTMALIMGVPKPVLEAIEHNQ